MKNIKTQIEAIRLQVSSSKLYVLHKANSLSETKDKLERLDEVVRDAENVLFGAVK